jgi:large subunit ribosomal protein L25
MKSLEVKCNLRESTGKKNSKNLRKQGMVPCVLYGGGENVHFLAPENDFRHLVYTPNAYLVKLDIDGKEYKCVLHEIQFHPVTDKILHMDFYQVFDDKYVTMQVPVQLNGVPEGVKQGGKLSLESRRRKARALPGDLPDVLVIDVSKVGLGKSIKVNELKFPGIQLLDSPNTVIASVKLTRAARGMTVEEEAAEAEAEAAAEAAESEDAASEGGTAEGGGDQKQD